MRVIYNDLLDIPPPRCPPRDAGRQGHALPEADVLSIHVTMLPGNANLVGRDTGGDEARRPRHQHQPRRGARRARPGRRACDPASSPAPPRTSTTPSRPGPTSRCSVWTT
jgi:hypothetical protein